MLFYFHSNKEIEKYYFGKTETEPIFFPKSTIQSGDLKGYKISAKTDQDSIRSFLKTNCIFSNIYALSVMVIAILGVVSSKVFMSLIICFLIYGVYALIYHFKLNNLVKNLESIYIEKDVSLENTSPKNLMAILFQTS